MSQHRLARFSLNRTGSDVFNNPSIDGLLETVVPTSKVAEVLGGRTSLLVRIVSAGQGGVELGRGGHRLVGGGQEDDLAVGTLSHGLHCLEVANLHGGGGREDIGGLSHQLGGFNL